MLGWHVRVCRQQNEGTHPASFGADQGACLAVWQTGVYGLDWIYELVKEANAIDLGGNGYPCEFTATAGHLTEALKRAPHTNATGVTRERDILSRDYLGKTTVSSEAIGACRPDEWLVVEAWDQS